MTNRVRLADGELQGLAFDWFTGNNIYVGTQGGYMLVCGIRGGATLTCLPILDGHTDIDGIALNPEQGYASAAYGNVDKHYVETEILFLLQRNVLDPVLGLW